jgi:hypothetical protein
VVCKSQSVGVMLLVYGDESMDETQERVCAVAGIIGTEEQWKALEWEWVKFNYGCPFHANACDSDHGNYATRAHWNNKALYRDLTILLANSGLCGVGKAIDLAAKQTIFPESEDLAYYTAFQRVVADLAKFARLWGDVAELTFDMRMESEHNAGFLYGSLRENEPEWTQYLAKKISFEFAKDNPRIQIADLLAREAMKALDNRIGPVKRKVRKSWLTLAQTGRFKIDAFSIEWFESLKQQMPELEKQLNMNLNDYMEWLRKRHRQPSISAMLQYSDWTARRDKVHSA